MFMEWKTPRLPSVGQGPYWYRQPPSVLPLTNMMREAAAIFDEVAVSLGDNIAIAAPPWRDGMQRALLHAQ